MTTVGVHTWLYMAVFLVPLLFAVLFCVLRLRESLFPWLGVAALPALLVALLVAPGPEVRLDPVLLGMQLGVDRIGRVFLLFTSMVWLAAAIHARGYFRRDERNWVFGALFLAAMAGNFGLILAGDAVSFYAFFNLMSLAAYGLVIHQLTPFARRAGLVYIALVVAGEAMVFPGILVAAGEAGSIRLEDIRQAVAVSPYAPLIVTLVLAGFAVKAGIMPLHVWLPLAHPAAPTPASAVLSGCMIKAGVLGWIRLLPLGEATLPEVATVAVAAGAITIVLGALIALTQTNPKSLLAYSSVSKMGFMIALVGLTLLDPTLYPLSLGALLALACFHALNKGALFLGCSITPGAPRAGGFSLAAKTGLVFSTLVFAGLPGFAGALAKLPIKEVLLTAAQAGSAGAWLLAVTSLSAVLTALVMLRFLSLAWPGRADEPAHGAPASSAAWFGLLAVLALYPLLLQVAGEPAVFSVKILAADELWSATWPLVLAAVVFVVFLRLPAVGWPRVPEGDLLEGAECALRWASRSGSRGGRRATGGSGSAGAATRRFWSSTATRVAARLERDLAGIGMALFNFLLVAMVAAVMLA